MSSKNEKENLPALHPGKGVTVRFFVDESKPSDSINSRKNVSTYDGEPDSMVFEVPPHWHQYHDEYWTVLEGRMQATVDGKTFTVKAGDETLRIARGSVHGMKAFEGEMLVFTESAGPPGAYKEAFIRDFFQTASPDFWLAMRVMYEGDTYPSLGGPKILDQVWIAIVGPIAKFIAPGKPSDTPTMVSPSQHAKDQ